jgi:hypothetical protein
MFQVRSTGPNGGTTAQLHLRGSATLSNSSGVNIRLAVNVMPAVLPARAITPRASASPTGTSTMPKASGPSFCGLKYKLSKRASCCFKSSRTRELAGNPISLPPSPSPPEVLGKLPKPFPTAFQQLDFSQQFTRRKAKLWCSAFYRPLPNLFKLYLFCRLP